MKRLLLTSITGLAASFALGSVAQAEPNVTLNGQAVQFSPGPLERNGRVFVPLRGIFERLGATVVYANGVINATGSDGRSVNLRIGSTTANVNGQSQVLDVAPFVVGASTYVPLRFVSSALGAGVNYDSSNNIVAITAAGRPATSPIITPQPVAAAGLRLRNEQPAAQTSVPARRPTISAEFTGRADPNSLRVNLDGLDVTAQTTRSEGGIVYAPPSPLLPGQHRVIVRGTDVSGQAFERTWQFSTGAASAQSTQNFLTLIEPGNGATVGSNFTLRGTTRPNARVHITAGAVANAIPGLSFGTGSYTGDTIADASGNFSQAISISAFSGGQIALTVVSTEAVTRETAQQQVRLRVS